MIISFAHRFIFVAIPKTATHSVREALRPHLGPRDWEQCLLFVEKKFPVAALAARRTGHLTLQEVRPFLVPGMWESFYKFTVVREPYARFVSQCWFLLGDEPEMRTDPLGRMKRVLIHREAPAPLRPQTDLICDDAGRIAVDRLIRFESLAADFAAVCRAVNLPPLPIGHTNASNPPPLSQMLDRELVEMIRERYAVDFERLGYPSATPLDPPP